MLEYREITIPLDFGKINLQNMHVSIVIRKSDLT